MCYEVKDGSNLICCLSLRTATIIVGWLDLIYAIVRGLYATSLLSNLGGGEEGFPVFKCLILVIIALIAVLEFVASFTLLWGVRNRLFERIKLWVPAQKVFLVVYTIIYVLLIALRVNWLSIIFLIIFHHTPMLRYAIRNYIRQV